MTETTAAAAGTALAQVAPGVLAQVKGGKPWTVADLANMLAGPAPEVPEAEPFPAPAKPVSFTPALRQALRKLPDVFGTVNPTTRRMLESAELASVTAEAQAIKSVSTPLADRLKAISEMVRHHQDCEAEVTGQALPHSVVRGGRVIHEATTRIADGVAKGHYLLAREGQPYETPVEGFEGCWQQRYVKGGTHQSKATLDGLLEQGTITRAEYNAFTRTERVLDEGKIATFIRKNPGRGLEILGAITGRSAPSASLYSPKK